MTIKSGAHLDKSEFVDWLDGTLSAERQQHAQECGSCRATAEELSLVMRTARGNDVPEPSPLFWDQLSDRVRLAVADASAPRTSWWRLFAMPGLQAAAAVVMVLLASVLMWRANPVVPAAPTDMTTATIAGTIDDVATDAGLEDLENDEAWALVRAMAEGVEAEALDTEGVAGWPGSADHLALRLTDRERLELARLLEEQSRKSGKADAAS